VKRNPRKKKTFKVKQSLSQFGEGVNHTFIKHQELSLKTHPDFYENWVQERTGEDPAILGFGELILNVFVNRKRAHLG
jgi:hypothetical protein